MQTFVALDIETTGFNPEKDQIIEFAAIKFNQKEILDTYQTLINPDQEIPYLISHMTGIQQSDTVGSPSLEEIKEEVTKFIGTSPIVGHNIDFDVTFLIQKGLPLTNELYDTLQLSSILLPGLPSYSLDTLGRILKIEHINKHRALSDTMATYELFLLLLKKIQQIAPQTSDQIYTILDKSDWSLKKLFYELNRHKPEPEKETAKDKKDHFDYSVHKVLSEKQFKTFFNQNGPLSQVIKDYESRPSQNTIVENIQSAFSLEHHCMIEAGTGTGKTLAYLLAAINFAKKNNTRVVISTYTKNLQDQIFNKDIPLIKEALHQIDPEIDFNYTLLKGRKNYISLKRLHTFMDRPFFEDHETTFLLKIILWLTQTQSGDLEEVNLQGKEFPLKDDICCDEYTEMHENFYDKDFLRQARQRAEASDIIIVNHALTIQDSIKESTLLPEYDYIIFDEAHHLERVTTDSLTINLSLNSYIKPYERIIRTLQQADKTTLVLNVSTKTEQILTRTEIFFGLLGIFIEKYASPDAYQSQLVIKEDSLSSLEWNKVKESAEIINDLNKQLSAELEIIMKDFSEDESTKDLAKEIKNLSFEIERKTSDMYTVILSGDWQNRINWTYKTYEGLGCVKSAPLQIGETLKTLFFDTKKSVILTSATLQTDNTFNYLKKSLGLDERFNEIALPSHFSYPDQVKILIPEDLPKPMTEGYFKSCANLIKEIIIKNEGRTMVLFTAKKALTATYMEIAPELKEAGFEVLAQGISGGKGKILQHFKQEPGACALFGTDSFWEGVDIAGDLLTCIVMQKLPFDPPSDPIIFARGQLFSNSFNEYQLPRAILKFKQGFGRLIRTSKDKGSIVILDSRILQNRYGHQFLESLPSGITIEQAEASQIANLL